MQFYLKVIKMFPFTVPKCSVTHMHFQTTLALSPYWQRHLNWFIIIITGHVQGLQENIIVCTVGFFLCAHKTEKKTQNCRKLLVLRASRLRSQSALILCGFSRRGSDAGALCVISAAWHKANIVPSGLFAPTRAASRRHSIRISQTFTVRARKWCPSLLPLQCDVMTD